MLKYAFSWIGNSVVIALLLQGSIAIPTQAEQPNSFSQLNNVAHAKLSSPQRHESASDSKRSPGSQSSFRYLNDQTAPFQVTSLPEVMFDIGEIYSGSLSTGTSSSDGEYFFVFQPSIADPVNEVTIWLNGGPGCTSLEGFFEENGRFVWYPGAAGVVENPYSWVNLTNVLWYALLVSCIVDLY
jgi:carboxypeptidase D